MEDKHVFVILLYRQDGKRPNICGLHPTKEMAEKYLPPIEEDVSTRRIFKVPINIFNTEIFLNNFLENAKHNFSSPTYIPQPIKTEQIRLEIEILEEPLFFDINF